MIHLNPVPLLFTPGVAAAGIALGGMTGFSAALVGWAAVVAAATAIVFLRKAFYTRSGTADG